MTRMNSGVFQWRRHELATEGGGVRSFFLIQDADFLRIGLNNSEIGYNFFLTGVRTLRTLHVYATEVFHCQWGCSPPLPPRLGSY